ncbi:MAG: HAD-IA family hydrolase [Bacteroidales bacterium]|jgi:phosphoglycolate phosphatase|nr:HAD-IA family hydrolase [Bacteroidales bacterium]
MGMIKSLIFDFDGTLGDTRANIVLTMTQTLKTMGYPVAGENEIASTIGLPLEEGFRQLVPGISEMETLDCAKTYRQIFEINRKKLVPKLFPYVRETLGILAEKGFVMTIASSRMSGSLNGFLNNMGISDLISYVVGADNVTFAKPHPEPVLKTLEALGVPPSEAMVIGDMPVDIIMGRQAGVKTCGVTYGNSSRKDLEEAGADYIIDDFPSLPDLLI